MESIYFYLIYCYFLSFIDVCSAVPGSSGDVTWERAVRQARTIYIPGTAAVLRVTGDT